MIFYINLFSRWKFRSLSFSRWSAWKYYNRGFDISSLQLDMGWSRLCALLRVNSIIMLETVGGSALSWDADLHPLHCLPK